MQANCESTTKDLSIDTTNDERNLVDVNNLVLNVSYDFGPVTLTSITSQREIEHFNGTWGWVMGNGPGSNFIEILNNRGETDAFSQELRLAGSTDRLDWVVGAYWFEEETDEALDVPLFRGVMPLIRPFGLSTTLRMARVTFLGRLLWARRYSVAAIKPMT